MVQSQKARDRAKREMITHLRASQNLSRAQSLNSARSVIT
jgi:hypothetical protein